jgi:hypothetical protein
VLPSYICSSSLTTIRVHVCTVHLLYIIDYNVCTVSDHLWKCFARCACKRLHVQYVYTCTCTCSRVHSEQLTPRRCTRTKVRKYGSTTKLTRTKQYNTRLQLHVHSNHTEPQPYCTCTAVHVLPEVFYTFVPSEVPSKVPSKVHART